MIVSQMSYSLVVILELNGVSEIQYKNVMMIDDGKARPKDLCGLGFRSSKFSFRRKR